MHDVARGSRGLTGARAMYRDAATLAKAADRTEEVDGR